MKVTYKNIPGTHYIENTQRNKIRWVLLEQVAPDEFVNTTEPFKCKDYFNDFVIYKHSREDFVVHNMRASSAEFDPDGGLYVLVYNTTAEFKRNVEAVLQPTFGDAWGAHVDVTPIDTVDGLYESGYAVLRFSPECLVSTFRISILALLIRNCNVPFLIKNYEERIDRSFVVDGGLDWDAYCVFSQKNFTFPEQEKFYWYCSGFYNSTAGVVCKYTKHDNGISAWSNTKLLSCGYYGRENWMYELPVLGDLDDCSEEEDYCEEEECEES